MRMNSCSDFSSSTNKTRRALCSGGMSGLVLPYAFCHLLRQSYDKRTSLVPARAGSFDLPAMLRNDAMADGEPQARAFPGAAAREEGLEEIFEHFLVHAAARILEHQLCHLILLRQGDLQRSLVLHA